MKALPHPRTTIADSFALLADGMSVCLALYISDYRILDNPHLLPRRFSTIHCRSLADESEVGIHPAYSTLLRVCDKPHPQEGHDCLLALLRQIRLDAKLRQVDLAKRLGQPQSFVSKYESGERRLDILELRSLCKAVGITLEQFVAKLEQRLP